MNGKLEPKEEKLRAHTKLNSLYDAGMRKTRKIYIRKRDSSKSLMPFGGLTLVRIGKNSVNDANVKEVESKRAPFTADALNWKNERIQYKRTIFGKTCIDISSVQNWGCIEWFGAFERLAFGRLSPQNQNSICCKVSRAFPEMDRMGMTNTSTYADTKWPRTFCRIRAAGKTDPSGDEWCDAWQAKFKLAIHRIGKYVSSSMRRNDGDRDEWTPIKVATSICQ